MNARPFSVLVLCTGNSARSILGEVLLGRLGAARYAAFERTWQLLEMRVQALIALPFETMDRADLAAEFARIGQMEGAA